jgi:hypothetical protein
VVESWLAAWADEPLTMTFPLPVRRAQELLEGTLRGPMQATPYGVYRVTGFGVDRGVRLEARRGSVRTPWVTQVNARLEADGFQTRLVGRVGIPLFVKAVAVAATMLVLFLLAVGTVAGIADRAAGPMMGSIALSAVGLTILHSFVVAAGRSRPADIAYVKYWLTERLA